MEPNDQLRSVNERRKTEEPATLKRYQDSSRLRLFRIIKKKFNNSFIGDLSKFETHFGSLWGHGKDEMVRTPEQEAWYELWQQCRTEILNNGNHQLRAVEMELNKYSMTWNRYQMTLPASGCQV